VPGWDEALAGGAARPRRESNGVGIAGFVCGLISLVLAVIPLIFFFVSIPTGIAGVILSVIGRRRAAEGAPSGDLCGRAGARHREPRLDVPLVRRRLLST